MFAEHAGSCATECRDSSEKQTPRDVARDYLKRPSRFSNGEPSMRASPCRDRTRAVRRRPGPGGQVSPGCLLTKPCHPWVLPPFSTRQTSACLGCRAGLAISGTGPGPDRVFSPWSPSDPAAHARVPCRGAVLTAASAMTVPRCARSSADGFGGTRQGMGLSARGQPQPQEGTAHSSRGSSSVSNITTHDSAVSCRSGPRAPASGRTVNRRREWLPA